MNQYKVIIIFAVAVFLSTLLVYALLTITVQISNVGKIVTFGVECDTQTINWGTLLQGDAASRTVHVRANGSQPITNLTFYTENMPAYLHLSWNYNGATIGNDWYPLTFTLTVDKTALPGDFSFTIIIIAENNGR